MPTLRLMGGPYDGAEISAELAPAQVFIITGVDVQGARDIRQPAEYQVDQQGRAHLMAHIRRAPASLAHAAGQAGGSGEGQARPPEETAHKGICCRHSWAWVKLRKIWICIICGMEQRIR